MSKTMTTTRREVRVLQPAKAQEEIVLPVAATASADQIKASMCSCVVHLCGCD